MNVAALQANPARATDQIDARAGIRSTSNQPLTGKALRNASPAEQSKQVAAQFEAILVRQLLGPTMTSMLGKEGGAATNVYGDMITNTFAEQLTRGGGFGLSKMIQQQLTPRSSNADLNSSADPAELP